MTCLAKSVSEPDCQVFLSNGYSDLSLHLEELGAECALNKHSFCGIPEILGSIWHCLFAPFPPVIRGGHSDSPSPSLNAVCQHFQRLWGSVGMRGDHHTPWLLSHLTGSSVSLQITIPRGTDGFGFTICCDSPVRVQAVDSGKRLDPFHPS